MLLDTMHASIHKRKKITVENQSLSEILCFVLLWNVIHTAITTLGSSLFPLDTYNIYLHNLTIYS